MWLWQDDSRLWRDVRDQVYRDKRDAMCSNADVPASGCSCFLSQKQTARDFEKKALRSDRPSPAIPILQDRTKSQVRAAICRFLTVREAEFGMIEFKF